MLSFGRNGGLEVVREVSAHSTGSIPLAKGFSGWDAGQARSSQGRRRPGCRHSLVMVRYRRLVTLKLLNWVVAPATSLPDMSPVARETLPAS